MTSVIEQWEAYHKDIKAIKSEIERLRAENEALRKDAERYRWLRDDCAFQIFEGEKPCWGIEFMEYGKTFDDAVDAEIAEYSNP